MKLYKHNKQELKYEVDLDEIIERFCYSSFANDKRRELKVRLALFIASTEGYESTVAKHSELVQLVKRYAVINYKFCQRHPVGKN